MDFNVYIEEPNFDNLESSLRKDIERVRVGVEQAMAERFFEIVRSNFGPSGVDRPQDWNPLSPPYAKKVRRDYATLFVTGRLEAGVKMETTPEFSRVFISDSDVSYASAQQWGEGEHNLPARPYFPIDQSGNLTPFSQAEVEMAARDAMARLLIA